MGMLVRAKQRQRQVHAPLPAAASPQALTAARSAVGKEVATGGIDSIQWFYSLCALAGSTTPSNCWSARARFAGNKSALPLFSGVSVDMLLVRWLNGALVGSRNHSSVSSTPISSAAVLLHEKVCNNPR